MILDIIAFIIVVPIFLVVFWFIFELIAAVLFEHGRTEWVTWKTRLKTFCVGILLYIIIWAFKRVLTIL